MVFLAHFSLMLIDLYTMWLCVDELNEHISWEILCSIKTNYMIFCLSDNTLTFEYNSIFFYIFFENNYTVSVDVRV